MSNQKKNPMRAFVLVSTITSCVLGGTIGGLVLGLWIDKLLGTEPIFLLICLLFGIFSGTYGIYKAVQPFLGDDE
ncbi:ATP synthase protein I [Bacillus sp. JCM 19046]|uniref:F0F1-type ATP synthase assembly protein I n=1 Tax=Shouchella xiaoxiensis TaxID=766895 RepID=A0ABS2SZA4_9BACI|nr:AtpZ/AtpI family protein [Shouchella xiaoxiensis]MBM7839562.1 F0F1-type ATP synthase assembly protein I [Shouchella xiaoxiensis]GAF12797.1 ATP synthase protein I [Bacillus sp. JCM 19045]GAF16805.1 ATP synthase protein I [Bacillus sp. JCM 19046]